MEVQDESLYDHEGWAWEVAAAEESQIELNDRRSGKRAGLGRSVKKPEKQLALQLAELGQKKKKKRTKGSGFSSSSSFSLSPSKPSQPRGFWRG